MGLPGGIASKLGENFENDCVVNNIIDVLKGDYKSLTREKIDIPFNNGLDYELVDVKDITYIVQVKKSNGNASWYFSDFDDEKIWETAAKAYKSNKKYRFITKTVFPKLEELLFLAKVTENIKQLNEIADAKENKNLLHQIIKKIHEFDLKEEDIIKYLRNFEIKVIGDFKHDDFKRELYFLGYLESYDALTVINSIVSSNESINMSFDSIRIERYLREKGIIKQLIFGRDIQTEIDSLNRDFYNFTYRKLYNGTYFDRMITDTIINEDKFISFIYGNAGVGKSAILIDYINKISEKDCSMLSINLQDYTDVTSSKQFINKLGLKTSIVNTLKENKKDRNIYIIFDQLDSINVLNKNRNNLLKFVCEEIRLANNLNNKKGYRFRFLLCCRKIDKNIFIEQIRDNTEIEIFNDKVKEYEIGKLSDGELIKLLGKNAFKALTNAEKELLKVFHNLVIYKRIKNKKITNGFDLIDSFINETIDSISCEQNIEKSIIEQQLDIINNYFSEKQCLSVNISLLKCNYKEIDKMIIDKFCEYNLLCNDGKGYISYSHQSIFDCLKCKEIYIKIISNEINIVTYLSKNNKLEKIEYIKQLFELLRQSDYKKWFDCIKLCLDNRTISFLIKEIAILSFVSDDRLSVNEYEYAKKLLYKNTLGTLINKIFTNSAIIDYFYHNDIYSFSNIEKSIISESMVWLSLQNIYQKNDDIFIELSDFYIKNFDDKSIEFIQNLIDDDKSSDKVFDYKLKLLSVENLNYYFLLNNNFGLLFPHKFYKYIKFLYQNGKVNKFDYSRKDYSLSINKVCEIYNDELFMLAKNYIINKNDFYYGESISDDDLLKLSRDLFLTTFERKIKNDFTELGVNLVSKNKRIQYYSIFSLSKINNPEVSIKIIKWINKTCFIKTLDFYNNRKYLEPLCFFIKNNISIFSNGDIKDLLDQIYNYKSPSLIEFAKQRFAQRKQGYYYDFYGEEQYNLLTSIPEEYYDTKIRNYYEVLKRKFNKNQYYNVNLKDKEPSLKSDYYDSYSVVSGVHQIYDKLRESDWRKLVAKTNWKTYSKDRFSEDGKVAISFDKIDFCEAFRRKAKEVPELFVNLVNKKTDKQIKSYIIAGICDAEYTLDNIACILEVLKENFDINNKEYLYHFLEFINKNLEFVDEWSKQKLLQVIYHPEEYEKELMNIYPAEWDKDLGSLDAHDFDSEALNRIQTKAISCFIKLYNIGQYGNEMFEELLMYTQNLKHPVFNISTLELLIALLDKDPSRAVKTYCNIANRDSMIIGSYLSHKFLRLTLKDYGLQYYKIISDNLYNQNSRVKELVLQLLINGYILYGYYVKIIKYVMGDDISIETAINFINGQKDKKIFKRAKYILKKHKSSNDVEHLLIKLTSENNSIKSSELKRILIRLIKKKKHGQVFYSSLYDKLDEEELLYSNSKLVLLIGKEILNNDESKHLYVNDTLKAIVKIYYLALEKNNKSLMKKCMTLLNDLCKRFGTFNIKMNIL